MEIGVVAILIYQDKLLLERNKAEGGKWGLPTIYVNESIDCKEALINEVDYRYGGSFEVTDQLEDTYVYDKGKEVKIKGYFIKEVETQKDRDKYIYSKDSYLMMKDMLKFITVDNKTIPLVNKLYAYF